MTNKVVDTESVISSLIKIEQQKKQELFTEWEQHDIIQNIIREIEQQENFNIVFFI